MVEVKELPTRRKFSSSDNNFTHFSDFWIWYSTTFEEANAIQKVQGSLKASDLGNAESTYILAKLYLSNKTIFYDEKKAYNTFVDAANQNHAKAQLMIGRFFLLGEIVAKDYEKALYYFKLASKQKEYEANCYTAYMYASETGVFQNFRRTNSFAKSEYEKGNKFCVKVWEWL